jgi:hypothetical protein
MILPEAKAARARAWQNRSVTPQERRKTDARRRERKLGWVAEYAPIVGLSRALRALED